MGTRRPRENRDLKAPAKNLELWIPALLGNDEMLIKDRERR
jgi:hypothetical protein